MLCLRDDLVRTLLLGAVSGRVTGEVTRAYDPLGFNHRGEDNGDIGGPGGHDNRNAEGSGGHDVRTVERGSGVGG